MGSSSKTYTNIESKPIDVEYKKSYNTMMLESYKHIIKGGNFFIDHLGRTMASNRSIFNDGFLNATGYNPNESISYEVIDETATLAWAQQNVSGEIDLVSNVSEAPLQYLQIALYYLQENYTLGYADRSVIYSDGRLYYYTGSIANGLDTLEISLRLNREDTVDEYVAANYDDTYTIDTYGSLTDGGLGGNYWDTELLHTIIELDPETGEPDPSTEVTEIVQIEVPVQYVTVTAPNPLSGLFDYVLSNFGGSTYYSVTETQYDDSGNYTRTIFSATIHATLVITSSGTLDAVTSYTVTYGDLSSYGIELSERIASYKSDVLASANQYIANNATFFSFVYTRLDETMGLYYQQGVVPEGLTRAEDASAYPIIPLKRRRSMVGTTAQRTMLLNKIGMVGNEFDNSLLDKDIYSTYMYFGINLSDTSTEATMYIFEALQNIVETKYTTEHKGKTTTTYVEQMTIKFSGLDIRTSLEASSKLVSGSIGPVGTYQASSETYEVLVGHDASTADSQSPIYYKWETRTRLLKRKQVSEDFYQEIGLVNVSSTFDVDGKKQETLGILPLVKDVMDKLPHKEYMYLLMKSIQLLVLTRVTVKTKWYRSGIFKGIMIIVAAAVAALTGGAGAFLLSIVLTMSVEMGLLSGTFGLVVQIAMIAYGGWQAATNTGLSTTQTVLMAASTLVSTVSLVQQISLTGIDGKSGKMGRLAEEQRKNQEELEESAALAQEVEDSTRQAIMMPQITHRYADTFYRLALGDVAYNYDILYNYDIAYARANTNSLT